MIRNSIFLLVALLVVSCSTTKRLADDQTLYTGVHKMRIEMAPDADSAARHAKVPASVKTAVRQPLSVKPNNPLFSPWVRTPLPVGLWAYNSLYTDKKKGFRAWMYRTFAKQPIILERDVQPQARTEMVRDILDNHGYFGSAASYELVPKKNPKKTRVSYSVDLARPWYYSRVQYWVDSLARNSDVRKGEQYNIDTLARERARITNLYRAKGYYYFRPEYVEYQADTLRTPYGVDLRVLLAKSIPPAALQPYRVGNVTLQLFSADGTGVADSTEMNGVKVWFQSPRRVRKHVINKAMTLHTGDVASLPDIDRVMNNLTGIGVFRYVNLEVPSLDSLAARSTPGTPPHPLDLTFSAAMDTPMEATIEADLAYKSSSFLGPSLVLGLSHNNIFEGGEVLALKLNGSYEWQTGNTSSSANSTAVNSYEVGLTASLTFPRMIVPNFILRAMSRPGTTYYQLGASLVNRPKFFRMVSFNFSNTYDFRTSSTVSHSFTPFKMVYNKLLSTTPDFDQTMEDNAAIAMSFDDQFIPSGSYTYTYDKRYGKQRRDRIVTQVTMMSAGNVWAALGAKKLFGQPLSQFFKETAELRIYKNVARVNTLAFRWFVGAGHVYGNSEVLPYTEQFYIGGANSIRAFTIRSLGPGSYRPITEDRYAYYDQTGDFKLEFNTEFRFKIAGSLNGAVFFDAGNIWLQKDDPDRPGGKLGSGSFWQQVATGTGAGLRYDLSFIVVRVDLGVGIHLPYDTGVRSSDGRRPYYNIPRFKDGLGFHLAIGYPF